MTSKGTEKYKMFYTKRVWANGFETRNTNFTYIPPKHFPSVAVLVKSLGIWPVFLQYLKAVGSESCTRY